LRSVLTRIRERQADYSQGPFLAFLADKSIDIRQRLAFAPHVAHFVLTFADLCTLILPREVPTDRYQELVNANCFEDKKHWEWFLSDLAQLGRDPALHFSEAVKQIWSESTLRTRRLSYHLVHLGSAETSLGRLVLVHIIEGAFQATVTNLEPAANEFMTVTGKRLHYLGSRHSEAEETHTLEAPEVRKSIEEIQLTADEAERFVKMVDDTFALFRAFSDEMYDLARASVPNKTA
jgi:hypothetical protein